MKIAIDVAGFSAAESDGFRRAMGTWRSRARWRSSTRGFVEGCTARQRPAARQDARSSSTRSRASPASASTRATRRPSRARPTSRPSSSSSTRRSSRPGSSTRSRWASTPSRCSSTTPSATAWRSCPVDINAQPLPHRDRMGRHARRATPRGRGHRPATGAWSARRRASCRIQAPRARLAARRRARMATASASACTSSTASARSKGSALDAELARGGPYRSLADVVARTGLSEEVVERLIRAGALDSLGRPRRELLWQLREVAGAHAWSGPMRRLRCTAGRSTCDCRPRPRPDLPPPSELERLGDSYAILSLDARRQVVELFRPALDQPGGGDRRPQLAEQPPGRVAIGGLVVTRQHPMTAKGTVFLALEDETGMVNVTLWPDTWARLRGVVRRHALLYVEGTLQREATRGQPGGTADRAPARPRSRRRRTGTPRGRPPARACWDASPGLTNRGSPGSDGSAEVVQLQRPERACRASSRALRFCSCACLSRCSMRRFDEFCSQPL